MKRMSKILKIAVALLLLLCTVTVLTACGGAVSYSDASGNAGEDLTWDFDAEAKTLKINGAGEIPDYESASEVPWYSVRGGVETVVLDAEVTAVGNYAFFGMSALKEADLSDAVERIGDFAFAFTALTDVDLPDSLTELGDSAFEACSALTEVVLPLSVESMGERCFAFCSSLTDAVLVSPLEEIPEEAFYKCTKLEHLVLHPDVQSGEIPVADSAFTGAASDPESEGTSFRTELVATYTLTIEYLFEDGTEAHESFTDTKVDGAEYSRLSPSVEGYEPDRDVVNGTVEGEDVTEKVIYTPVEEETTEETEELAAEDEPEEPEEEGFTVGTAIAIVVLVVVIAAIVVGAVLLLRPEKKGQKGRPAQNDRKNNKKR